MQAAARLQCKPWEVDKVPVHWQLRALAASQAEGHVRDVMDQRASRRKR